MKTITWTELRLFCLINMYYHKVISFLWTASAELKEDRWGTAVSEADVINCDWSSADSTILKRKTNKHVRKDKQRGMKIPPKNGCFVKILNKVTLRFKHAANSELIWLFVVFVKVSDVKSVYLNWTYSPFSEPKGLNDHTGLHIRIVYLVILLYTHSYLLYSHTQHKCSSQANRSTLGSVSCPRALQHIRAKRQQNLGCIQTDTFGSLKVNQSSFHLIIHIFSLNPPKCFMEENPHDPCQECTP